MIKEKKYKTIFSNNVKFENTKILPKISIVTVVKNGQSFLEKTIKSVISQKYKNIEYVIIDGYSNDNTSSIIKKYKKNINIYIKSKDQNLWEAMNLGIQVSNGSIIVFLNSDDIFCKNACLYASNYFKKKKIDYLFGTVKKHTLKHGFYKWKSMFSFGFYTTHSIGFFAKKKLYLEYGNYNPKFMSADLDFFLRIIFKRKARGISSKKKELFGYFRTGGFSSKIKYREHLMDLNLIRINNNQNVLFVYFLYFIKIIKKPIKFILNKH